jgi:hypothetical protein
VAGELAAQLTGEESGFAGRAIRLVGVYERDTLSRPRHPVYGCRLVFLCELERAEPAGVDTAEIVEVDFFAADSLPPLSGRTSAEQRARAFACAADPSLPAEFD